MIPNYIDGKWIESENRETVPVTNPATGEKLDDCPLGSPSDADQAIRAAAQAFQSWRETPAPNRIQYFFKLKALLEENADEISKLITLENGKTLPEAKGSLRRAIQMVETACSIPTLMMGESFEDIASGIDCVSMKRPLGVFAAITPFNFPAMVAYWFWPFAVASGNTYVVKPSERVPLTQKRMFELIDEAGFPKGVVNLVNGGRDVANRICEHPDVQGVSFVGSTPVAKHIYETGSRSGKRVQSLGGAKNYMVVLPDALMDRAVQTALESICGCAGERCLAGSVVLAVGDQTYSQVKEKMVAAAKKIQIGNGLEPTVTMGPLISQAAKERVSGLIQSAEEEGAEILLDGRKEVDHLPGYFLKPTVIAGVTEKMKIAQEEIFGPVVCIGQTKSLDESIDWLNRSPFGNTTTLFTTSGAAARRFSYRVDPSMIGINIGVPAPMSFFSFGGIKDSFYGDTKAHGKASMNFFTDTKVTIQRWEKESSIW